MEETIKANEIRKGDNLRKSIHKESYYHFFKWAWNLLPSNPPLKEAPHLKLIADELQAVGERMIAGEPKEYDLIINVPPGSSKSSLATIFFPVWLWIRKQDTRIISGSFSSALSIEHAINSKDVIQSEEFQRLYGDLFQIRKDINAKTRYKTIQGGERKTTSSGSSITGSHAHIILIDDPIDPKGARSEAILKNVNEWMDKTIPSRVVDKEVSPIILIMQRLHEEDPTGNMLEKREKGKSIRQICLPATDDYPIAPAEAADIYVDGLLDPVRMPRRVVKDFEATLGEEEYAGQFGQQPAPPGGLIVKKEWLPIIPFSKLPPALKDEPMDFVGDTAQKASENNDPSALLAWKVFKGYVFLFDYIEDRVEFPDLVDMATSFVGRLGDEFSLVHIEPKSSGSSLVQHLIEFTDLNVVEWSMPDGDKESRLRSITPFLRSKKFVLVKGAWNEKFIHSVTMFPRAKHDEAVDCLVMAAYEGIVRGTGRSSGGYEAHT